MLTLSFYQKLNEERQEILEEFARTGGDFHMIQLWVNLPAKDKMTEPKYQAITNDEFGKYHVPDDLGVVEVVAGEYEAVKGPASTFSPVEIYIGKLKKDAKLAFSTPANFNTGLLSLEGDINVNETTVPADNFVLFANDGEEFSVEAETDAMFFVLSGEPLGEPIASYGPFVMNTQDEIRQAMRDYGTGKFGHLE